MNVSANEVEGVAHRAALGLGLPHGHAEDLARVARVLATCMPDGLAELAAAADALDRGETGRVSWFAGEDGWTIRPAEAGGIGSALWAASAILDLWRLATSGMSPVDDPAIQVVALDRPCMAAAAVAAVGPPSAIPTARRPVAVHLVGHGGGRNGATAPDELLALIDGDRVRLSPRPAGAGPGGAFDVLIRAAASSDVARMSGEPDMVAVMVQDGDGAGRPQDVPDAVWRRLNAYADRTLVAASERSRLAGAGAGITDND